MPFFAETGRTDGGGGGGVGAAAALFPAIFLGDALSPKKENMADCRAQLRD